MEPLTIRLLGNPVVMVGPQPLLFPTRKVLALLVYLLVEGRRTSRETLTVLLWPENAPEKAAVTLRGTLSRLRKALQPAGGYILSEGTTIAFDFEKAHDLDVARLAAIARPETTLDELGSILPLDRGEFLEGFTLPDAPGFDTWATIQREVCLRQSEAVYDRLSQHLLATHDSAAAVETAARWVTRAPFSEQAYRRLMAAQALCGQRPAALQTFERLQATLQQELGLEPSRETILLADNIGRGRMGEEHPGLPARAGSSRTGATGRLTLPLVGRSAEHRRLDAAFRQAGQDGTQVMVLIGAAGSGKTRLVSTFQEWAMLDSPGAAVWQGRAFETGGRLAYQPVVEALRSQLEVLNAPEDLLEDVWLAELSQLMPELRARYPDLPPPLTGAAHFVRARLFEAVALLGSALAERRTAVFVLDDMQWADADALDLIHYLARRWTEMGAPILLLLAFRQEAYAADAALREWLTSLGRDTPLTRLLLDSLGSTAIQQLVTSLAGVGADEKTAADFAAWLWAETRGLPFFIEALLQMLVEQGLLPVVSDEGQPAYDFAAALEHVRSVAQVPLPPGVREVIQARLGQRSKEAGALLLAAAVLGRTCTFERLCQVADLSETDALEALEALLDGRLLMERPSDRRPYTLAHDYIREVVYSESRVARRRVFHRRALLALEAAGAPAAECAFHAQASLLDEPAFRYSVAAGSEAFASYAAQEALAHFDTARGIARHMETRGVALDEDLLGSLYRKRGQALELIQEDEAAEDNYEEMMAVAVQRRDQDLEFAALISLSTLYGSYTGVFNPPKAKEMALKALEQARERDDKQAEAGALWALTAAEFFSAGDNNLILDYGVQGLELARELGLKDLIGGTLNILTWAFVGQKQLEQARAALAEAQTIWRELGNLPRLGEASRFMLNIHGITGDYRRTLPAAEKLVELGVSSGSRLDQINALLWLANGCARQGRFGQALNYLEKVEVLTKAVGYSNEEQAHEIGRVGLYLASGALDEAERWADRLYAQRETIMPSFVHYYLTDVARVKIARGKLQEGRAILDQLLASLPANVPASHNITAIAVAFGEVNLAQGQSEAIFSGLEEWVRPFREAGFNRLLAEEYWLRGRAALILGQYDEARNDLLKAREVADYQEERTVLWRILVSLADVEEACGDKTAAGGFLDQAREVVNYITEYASELREPFLAWPEVQAMLTRKVK